MSSSPSISRTPGVLAQRLDDEIVLLDAERGHYFALNETGARIWEWIGEQGVTLAELVERLVDAYEVEAADAERDVRELLARLEAQRLVQARAPEPPDQE